VTGGGHVLAPTWRRPLAWRASTVAAMLVLAVLLVTPLAVRAWATARPLVVPALSDVAVDAGGDASDR